MVCYEQKNIVDLVISSGFNQVGFNQKKRDCWLGNFTGFNQLGFTMVIPWLNHSKIFWKKTLKIFEKLVDYGYNQPGDLKNRGENHGYYLGLTTV